MRYYFWHRGDTSRGKYIQNIIEGDDYFPLRVIYGYRTMELIAQYFLFIDHQFFMTGLKFRHCEILFAQPAL